MKQLNIFQDCTPSDIKPKTHGTKVSLFVDGASRKNPGIAGGGIVIMKHNERIFRKGFYLGHKTNNQAEYLALLLGILYSKRYLSQNDLLMIVSDSELLIKQLKGEYKVRNQELKQLYSIIIELLSDIRHSLCHVKREHNVDADAAANEGIDKHTKIPEEFLKMLHSHGLTI